ncbi:GGDEF domain-containing protein [Acaryochloris sp. IP29b_bin.148]|uniref:GGDEF domain-containing protein n=1 Tax=Acaryochloris sp. IP29b_bin.148 TaxID=2969218 RepID=UPI0026323602|nr:GGDEF domain-containing protein [Acaryochloris sp. IP29b_bin.148]
MSENYAIPHLHASRVTLSLGVATVTPNAPYSEIDLLAAADKALYPAKQHGRNQVRSRTLQAVNR